MVCMSARVDMCTYELWFLFVCVWIETRKPFRRTLPRARVLLPRASIFISRGLLPPVGAQVLRRLLVWANHAFNFNHQERMQAYIKRVKTQASTFEEAIGGFRLRLVKPLGVGKFGGFPIHNWG